MKSLKLLTVAVFVFGLSAAAFAVTNTPATPTPTSNLTQACKAHCPDAKDDVATTKCVETLQNGANAVTFKQTECFKAHAALMNAKKSAQPTPPVTPAQTGHTTKGGEHPHN